AAPVDDRRINHNRRGATMAVILPGGELDAGAQKTLRIDRIAIDAGFVMQMRPGGAAGGADVANGLADADALADLDANGGEVAVAGGEAVAMVDLDHAAVAAVPAGLHD